MCRMMRTRSLDILKIMNQNLDRCERKFADFNEKLKKDLNGIKEYIVFWKDKDSVYLGCNQLFADLIGVDSPDNIIGYSDAELVENKKESQIYKQRDLDVLNNGNGVSKTFEYCLNNGRSVVISKMPLLDDNKNILGILGAGIDITEEKKKTSDLEDSRELKFYSNRLQIAMKRFLESI